MKILIGGIMQESNTFSPAASSLQYFKDLVYLTGEEVSRMKEVRTEIGGFYRAAAEEGAEVVPTLFTQAVSAGKVERASFDALKRELVDRMAKAASAGPYDGILIAFHGAMVAENADDAEGNILEAIRSAVGSRVPIVISLDMHANVTRRMTDNVNGLIGYKTYPHIDHFDAGYRAGKLLFSILKGDTNPEVTLRKVPMILPAENMQTTGGPMQRLIAEAEAGERRGDSLATSLFPVQPWLDIDELGLAVTVVHDDAERAAREAERLAGIAWVLRHEFDVRLYSVREVVDIALSGGDTGAASGPVVISDSADATGAGSPGDSNAVLKQLLELGVQDRLTCLLSIVDPQAVDEGIKAGIGSRATLRLGYYMEKNFGDPIEVEGIVAKAGIGTFRFGDGFQSNLQGNMGRCIVFQVGRISVLVMENPTFTIDPAMYRCMGLEPADADLVMVKSAAQFRSCYERLSSRMFILDTPGSSTANLRTLDFRKVKRPFYPFDDFFDWKD